MDGVVENIRDGIRSGGLSVSSLRGETNLPTFHPQQSGLTTGACIRAVLCSAVAEPKRSLPYRLERMRGEGRAIAGTASGLA